MTETAKLQWVIVYVPDVEAAIAFFERAFGLTAPSSREEGDYGELDTGQTKLAFASEALGDSHFEQGFRRPSADQPGNVEIALVFDDAGGGLRPRGRERRVARSRSPSSKPWGQMVAYVRDPFGTLIELASPTG